MKIEGKSLLVFGSRSLDNDECEREIENFIAGTDYKYIITALDPKGVCERVKHYCRSKQSSLVLIQIALDKSRAAGMHEARSITALKMADHMLAIWDGKSKGTAGEIRLAKKMKIPTTVILLQPIEEISVDILAAL